MRSLRIIESFSIFLLYFVMSPLAGAQDLEEVLPRKVEVSVIDYSDDFEPSISTPLTVDSVGRNGFEEVQAPQFNQIDVKQQDIEEKEIQLGMILRNAYYQKITTPRWAKILSTKSWRAAFLKWRYYAQIEAYVRSSSGVLTEIKEEPKIKTITSGSSRSESHAKTAEDSILITPKNEAIDKKANSIAQNISSINRKEVSEEESFDSDSMIMIEERFDFSVFDLTLPDSMISEKELYNETIVNLSEDLVDIGKSLDNTKPVLSESSKEISNEGKKTDPIVTQDLKTKTDPVAVGSKILTEDYVKEEQVVQSTRPKVEKPIEKSTPPPPIISDRRTMTERFASMYRKLPWPVNGGAITDRYGYRKNAAARGLKKENYGIDISAPSSSRVNAVFSGTVLMAIRQAPYDYIVTLKHGDFTTAYYFLEKVNVQVGDQVQGGQSLGTLRQRDGAVPFHFEIWQDQERVNPEPWLRP